MDPFVRPRHFQINDRNNLLVFSENEKQRRWQEIRKRQHRLISEVDRSTPAHIEQIMKSGFSITDIKGLPQIMAENCLFHNIDTYLLYI